MKKLRVLDLFSGIGGFSLGLERTGGFETVAFCEIEPYPQKVLKKHWPDVPLFEDIRNLKGDEVGSIDLICGGYPCQPFSTAGERKGADDDRHLWPEVHRLVATIRPTWCLFENVAGHISMGLDQVLSDLENEGYTARPLVIPACATDAPHRRDRVWILANSEGNGRPRSTATNGRGKGARPRVLTEPAGNGVGGKCGVVADTRCGRQSRPRPCGDASNSAPESQGQAAQPFNGGVGNLWCPEPGVGRVAHGVPRRVDRLKGLGNAVVPQIPEMIGYAILEAEKNA